MGIFFSSVETIAPTKPSDPTTVSSVSNAKIPLAALGLLLSLLWFILCWHLSSEWSINEQYGYGWFVPFFAAYIFWLRWETRPEVAGQKSEVSVRRPTSDLGSSTSLLLLFTFVFPLLAALLPIRLFEVGNPDWRPLGWLHAGIVVGITLLLVRQIGGTAWLKHFAFPICFIFVAVPWVSGIETPVIQGLMRGVAAVAAETLNLFGIPAHLEGNLIRVSSGLVGVNEACSGVRSLQTSLMIGLLFGELKRFALVRRILLVAGAVAIALVANCARALFLVWLMATRNPESSTHWHDFAGYSIVALVFVGTMAIAALIGRKVPGKNSKVERPGTVPQSAIRNPQSHFLLSTSYFLLPLLWLLFTEVAVESWYRAHERNLIPEKNWSVQWPTGAPGFRDIAIDEGVRRTLRFDDGHEASWVLSLPNETNISPLRTFGFFFRWNAGGSSVLRARAHRPDICLPNVGWRLDNDRGVAEYRVGNLEIPFHRVVFRRASGSAMAYTFFCLQEDRRHPSEPRPDLQLAPGLQPDWSLGGRIQTVRQGVRNLGQQVLELVLLSPAPLDDNVVEEKFAAVLQGLVRP